MHPRSYDFTNSQAVAYTDTAGQSAAIEATQVRIVVTTDAWMARGADPTAVAGVPEPEEDPNAFLPAGTPIEMAWKPGDKASFIRAADSGTASILPIV
jgi:hypothetical protein